MFRFGAWLAALAVVVATGVRAASLEAYGQLPTIEQVAMSPDGGRFGMVCSDGVQRRLIVETTADRKPVAVVNLGASKVQSIQWAGQQHIIITSSRTDTIMGVAAGMAGCGRPQPADPQVQGHAG